MPKADTLAIIADYLGTSADYLLGRTDEPEMNITVTQTAHTIESSPIQAVNGDGISISADEREILDILHSLTAVQKAKAIIFLDGLRNTNASKAPKI